MASPFGYQTNVKQYDDQGHIIYQGDSLGLARRDATDYGYDLTLDPRSGSGIAEAIDNLRTQVGAEATKRAITTGGDYNQILNDLMQQTGVGLTTEQIVDNLKRTGSTGINYLPDNQPLTQGAGGGFTVGGMMTGVQAPTTFDQDYGKGNYIYNWAHTTQGADGNWYYDDGSRAPDPFEQALAANNAAAAEQARLAALPENRGAGFYDGNVSQFSDGSYVGGGNGRYADALGSLMGGSGYGGYNLESDPVWQAYRSQYTRLGDKAMQDTLGQLAARTGGLASSYAGSAAQQTYDEYMKGLSDIIPTLYNDAFDRQMKLAQLQLQQQAANGGSGSGAASGTSYTPSTAGRTANDVQAGMTSSAQRMVDLIEDGYVPTAQELNDSGLGSLAALLGNGGVNGYRYYDEGQREVDQPPSPEDDDYPQPSRLQTMNAAKDDDYPQPSRLQTMNAAKDNEYAAYLDMLQKMPVNDRAKTVEYLNDNGAISELQGVRLLQSLGLA